MAPTVEDVKAVYEMLLARLPESQHVSDEHRKAGSFLMLVQNVVESQEFIDRMRGPFFNYTASFDAIGTMRAHMAEDVLPEPDFYKNFLGVRMRERYVPSILSGRNGCVEPIPIPANWHADIAEWAAVLRAVDLAEKSFTIVELGCGWGCWLNNAGAAARRRGLTVRQIGIEGDEGHVRMARDAGEINGFGDAYRVHHGLAGTRSGTALFPCQARSGIDWGLAPILDASGELNKKLLGRKTHVALPMVSLEELTEDIDRVDLLHIDIQGSEADLIANTIDFLTGKVAYIFVGSHSREIEGRVTRSLVEAGWKLEIDRPAIFDLSNDQPKLVVDGAMGWRNPRLASA